MPRHIIPEHPATDNAFIAPRPSPLRAYAACKGDAEEETPRHPPKSACLAPPARSGRRVLGAQGRAAKVAGPTAALERVEQLEIPFLWIEKAIMKRLETCLSSIDLVPLRMDTHDAWLRARTAVYDAISAIVELRRTAYQMLGHNEPQAICHMKSEGSGSDAFWFLEVSPSESANPWRYQGVFGRAG